MPTPSTSSSTPCMEVLAVSCSSRKLCTPSMKVEERCEERKTGTPASSPAASMSGGISMSFVTTRQATSWAKKARRTSTRRSRGRVLR